jgi:hypothetical protein
MVKATNDRVKGNKSSLFGNFFISFLKKLQKNEKKITTFEKRAYLCLMNPINTIHATYKKNNATAN